MFKYIQGCHTDSLLVGLQFGQQETDDTMSKPISYEKKPKLNIIYI